MFLGKLKNDISIKQGSTRHSLRWHWHTLVAKLKGSSSETICPAYRRTSLFEQTLQRTVGCSAHSPIVVCNEAHRFLVAEQCVVQGVEKPSILLEPTARNTAAAIAIAALEAEHRGIREPLLVCPSDHVIEDIPAFHTAVARAAEEAASGALVTFGIQPLGPETGYGYIKAVDTGVADVELFVEKPDKPTAQSYLDSDDNYYWNSGVFVFTAKDFLAELGQHKPDILRYASEAFEKRISDLDFERIDKQAFMQCESISVDYAVMEKSERVRVVPFSGGWSDLGVWSSVYEAGDKDENGNVLNGDTCTVDSTNCLVRGNHRLVTLLGCENLAVIETPDSIAVINMENSQDVKKLVDALAASGRGEITDHSCVYRPWGNYESIDVGNRYQVKRLVVKPGAQLSLQKHHHRAEHWVVVRGTAKITRDDEEFMLSENQSTYIPLGAIHRLENPGSIDLELIEVQSGSYLGEDDIVRVEDNYGRVKSIDTAKKKQTVLS